jgi:peptide/nickel transport system substrate-binding protein
MRFFFVFVAAVGLAVGAACTPAPPVAPTANPPPPTAAAKPAVAPTLVPTTVLAAPTTVPKPATAAKAVPTLSIAIPADEGTLTPYSYKFGNPGYYLLMLVYDSILQLDADNVPKPLLAKEVKVSPDGSSYDITLRSGVRWHDGQPLTSDDVKFTYEYFLKNTHSRFTASLRPVANISTSGTDALSIKLSAPNPSFTVRALADVPIIPRHVWEAVPADKTKETLATIGSGPYKLVQADPDTGYRMRANTDYFLGPPAVDQLVFPIVKDTNTALQALRAGEIQGVTRGLTPEQIPQFSQTPFKVAKGPGFASTLLQLNTERAPLDRVEVRQAIDLAIDKKKLVDTVLIGAATVAAPGFIHPDSPNHDPSVQTRFDVGKARQLLDQIGATPGGDGVRMLDGSPLTMTILVYANDPVRVRTAELISGMLKDAGIQADIKALDPNAVDALVWPEFDAAKGRNYDMSLWGWSAPLQVDAGRLVDLVHSDYAIGRNNIGAYQSAEVTRIADDLRTTADETKRKDLVQALERTVARDVPFVMLFFQDGDFAYRAEAYDGWVYQKGQGIYTKLSFIPGFGH